MMWRMKELFRVKANPLKLLKYYIILMGTGCLLLILVHCLPEERIREHIEYGSEFIIEEGNYPYMGIESGGHILDNYTDALLLNFNYVADSTRPVYSAFVAQAYQKQGVEGVNLLDELLNDDNWRTSVVGDRSSNWLGMNIILRPLLFLFGFVQCRIILNIVSYLVLIITIIMIAKKAGGYLATGFGLTMIAFNYYSLSISFSLGVFCVLLACAVICYVLSREISEINLLHVMFVTGIATAYVDWLSIPLITWGLPILVVLEVVYKQKQDTRFAEYFNAVFQSSVGWCLGYAGMIISKCMVAMAVQGSTALAFFLNRVSTDTASHSAGAFGGAVRKLYNCFFPFNVRQGDNSFFIAIMLSVILLTIAVLCISKKRAPFSLMVIIVSLAPMVYYVYVRGHVHHTGIEFRTLMISFFAVWIMLKPIYNVFHERITKAIRGEK